MSTLRILLAQRALPERAARLRVGLERLGHQVVGDVSDVVSVVQAARALQPDLIVLDLALPLCPRDALAAVFALAKDGTAPLIVLAAAAARDDELVASAVEAGVMAYLPFPCTIDVLGPQIETAVARWRELRQLERDLAKTRERLRDRGIVERAKAALIELRGMNEAAAYEWLRTTSMHRRAPMRVIAEAVLLAAEAHRPDTPAGQTG